MSLVLRDIVAMLGGEWMLRKMVLARGLGRRVLVLLGVKSRKVRQGYLNVQARLTTIGITSNILLECTFPALIIGVLGALYVRDVIIQISTTEFGH